MKDSSLQILIVGYGEMGHAMETLLAGRHHLCVWQRPAPGRPSVDLEQAAAASDFVLFCVPAQPIDALLGRIVDHLPSHSLCLSIAKGLDDAGRPVARVLYERLHGRRSWAVIYGPMISEEIVAGRPAFAQVGTGEIRNYERLCELFAGGNLFLRHSRDATGLSWSAVLKNVYAILFGISDELGLGDNTRGHLAAATLQEMERIVRRLGGDPLSCRGLAGLGDLITTATSPGSHHRELGRKLVRGEGGLTGEGVHTLAMLRQHRILTLSDWPLLGLVDAILRSPVSAGRQMRDALEEFYSRRA